jgi:hypothetical protein
MKTNSAELASGARIIGSVIRVKTRQREQPSTSAASSISRGMSSKKVFISQKAKGRVTMP